VFQLGLLARLLLCGLPRAEAGARMSVELARLRRDAPERAQAIAQRRGVAVDALHRLTEPFLGPIRRMLPDLGGIDISPIVLLLALQFLRYLIVYYAAPLFL
jgi:hypothetical protein